MRRPVLVTLGAAAVLAAGVGIPAAQAATSTSSASSAGHSAFVTRVGSELFANGRPFRFGGSNTYYLEYSSNTMVDADLQAAANADFQVMRTWGFMDIGDPADPSTNVDPSAKDKGMYLQYWNGTAPAVNTGDNGLKRLDYVINKASQLGLRLVIPFTNNWRDFGGMDQYVRDAGDSYHDDFYSDPKIQGWFQNYMSTLLNHVNAYSGIAYKNDPTIMTWELGNEPRCKGTGTYPPSPSCSTATITGWADKMSRYIKSIDKHHLVSVGDEGFYCNSPTDPDWTRNCGEGVDEIALTKLPAIDVMSFHSYPDYWGKDRAWAKQWIVDHARDARKLGKAVMFGEYGWQDKATRNVVFKEWTDTFLLNGGNGALYWMLADKQDNGTLYPDYDGFTVYCPSPVCTTLTNFAHFQAGKLLPIPAPVADNDNATADFNTTVTVSPLANDIAYLGSVKPSTVDLDPATAGRQTSFTTAGGSFTVDAAGVVTFVPTTGFSGRAAATYTVADLLGHTSNAATIAVTVKPDPNATVVLFNFEDGTQGWGLANWQDPSTGSVSQTTAFHSDGSAGLHVTTSTGDWFTVGFDGGPLLNLTGKLFLKYEMSGDASFGTQLAVQAGSSYTWCQIGGTQYQSGGTMTVEYDLSSIASCDPGGTGLSQIHGLFLWFNTGNFDIDAVRVE